MWFPHWTQTKHQWLTEQKIQTSVYSQVRKARITGNLFCDQIIWILKKSFVGDMNPGLLDSTLWSWTGDRQKSWQRLESFSDVGHYLRSFSRTIVSNFKLNRWEALEVLSGYSDQSRRFSAPPQRLWNFLENYWHQHVHTDPITESSSCYDKKASFEKY